MNALRFKLTQLNSITIRYEVIYKNLLRDLRKYFIEEFNERTNLAHKRKARDFSYVALLREFVADKFSRAQLARLDIHPENVVFHLGALMYPKLMLASLDQSNSSDQIRVY